MERSFEEFYETLLYEFRLTTRLEEEEEEERSCKGNCAMTMCLLCGKNLRNIVFLHCRHCVLCSECVQLCCDCPKCKKEIAAYIKIAFE